ncbi:unnamed protein product [Closterium sp. Yama58-4]|nr:unnamed protein product [Closterium sp. Yama58-4]
MEKLDGRDIMSLALCNKSFLSIAMEEYTWKTRCLQELGCNAPSNKPQFGWLDIYKSIIDWMRIGAFSVTSGRVVATDTLQKAAGFQREGDSEAWFQCNEDCGLMASWTIDGVQNGIWIAGTMQTLDARHYELFLHDEWKCGEWKYEQLASHEAPFHCPQAAGGLFDAGTIGRQELKAPASKSHEIHLQD